MYTSEIQRQNMRDHQLAYLAIDARKMYKSYHHLFIPLVRPHSSPIAPKVTRSLFSSSSFSHLLSLRLLSLLATAATYITSISIKRIKIDAVQMDVNVPMVHDQQLTDSETLLLVGFAFSSAGKKKIRKKSYCYPTSRHTQHQLSAIVN